MNDQRQSFMQEIHKLEQKGTRIARWETFTMIIIVSSFMACFIGSLFSGKFLPILLLALFLVVSGMISWIILQGLGNNNHNKIIILYEQMEPNGSTYQSDLSTNDFFGIKSMKKYPEIWHRFVRTMITILILGISMSILLVAGLLLVPATLGYICLIGAGISAVVMCSLGLPNVIKSIFGAKARKREEELYIFRLRFLLSSRDEQVMMWEEFPSRREYMKNPYDEEG